MHLHSDATLALELTQHALTIHTDTGHRPGTAHAQATRHTGRPDAGFGGVRMIRSELAVVNA